MKQFFYKYRLFFVLILVVGIFSAAEPKFLRPANLTNVLWSVALIGIMAAGALYPIITGGIDLSVGSVAGFTSVGLAWFMVDKEIGFGIALILMLLINGCIGFLHGICITKFKIPAFITTMATLKIVYGLALTWSGGRTTPITEQSVFLSMGVKKIMSVPLPVFIMLGVMLLSYWLLNKASFGRKIIATGGNATASYLSGVPVDRIVVAGYVFSSLCATLSGTVLASMTQQGKAAMAKGYEMDVISAIVLGGASMAGGKGSVWGTLFGVALIGLISNGMTMMNAPSEWHNIVKGMIILVTVAFDVYMSGQKGGKENGGK